MFSSRVQADLSPNRLAVAVERARAAGRNVVDLTLSNPTRAELEYPADLLAPLADPRGLAYTPSPFGAETARSAVAAEYARRGVSVPTDQIVLTASTSEAYSIVFKVLCDPGDEVLIPRPSYPLFEHLARLDAVAAKPYDLEYGGRWSVDVGSIERAMSPRTRAVLIVSPNNPTGSFVSARELDDIAALSASHDAAIVADEVFADYELEAGAAAAAGSVLSRRDVLMFSLGGLSKSVGLPQVKLGWIAAAGPGGPLREALARLEIACDTYLSVATPVQIAAAELLCRGATMREQIQRRVGANYRHLVQHAQSASSCRVLAAEGGWYAVMQVPTLGSEEELVLDLFERQGVLVHPGYFFDFPRESYLILSLLTPPASFAEGVARIFGHFDCSQIETP
jgi:hypothetical protein